MDSGQQTILDQWCERGIVLASSAAARRSVLGKIFNTESIITVSVPDVVEKERWTAVEVARDCRPDFAGGVHEIARVKLEAAMKGRQDQVGFAMDTVPFVLRVGKDEEMRDMKWELFEFDVFHKPRSEELARTQLTYIFAQLVCGFQSRKELLSILGGGSLCRTRCICRNRCS